MQCESNSILFLSHAYVFINDETSISKHIYLTVNLTNFCKICYQLSDHGHAESISHQTICCRQQGQQQQQQVEKSVLSDVSLLLSVLLIILLKTLHIHYIIIVWGHILLDNVLILQYGLALFQTNVWDPVYMTKQYQS